MSGVNPNQKISFSYTIFDRFCSTYMSNSDIISVQSNFFSIFPEKNFYGWSLQRTIHEWETLFSAKVQ